MELENQKPLKRRTGGKRSPDESLLILGFQPRQRVIHVHSNAGTHTVKVYFPRVEDFQDISSQSCILLERT